MRPDHFLVKEVIVLQAIENKGFMKGCIVNCIVKKRLDNPNIVIV